MGELPYLFRRLTLASFRQVKKNKNNVIALDVNLDKDEKMIL